MTREQHGCYKCLDAIHNKVATNQGGVVLWRHMSVCLLNRQEKNDCGISVDPSVLL